MTILFAKIFMTSLVVFLIMLMIDGFCNYEDKAKGHLKNKVPVFVPYVGALSGIIMVVSVVVAIIMGIWS